MVVRYHACMESKDLMSDKKAEPDRETAESLVNESLNMGWTPQEQIDYFAEALAAARREERERHKPLAAVLEDYLAAYPAFRIKPVGSPGSTARNEQNYQMALEDRARAAIRALKS